MGACSECERGASLRKVMVQVIVQRGDPASLGAWLYKKHQSGRSRLRGEFGKRWVHVNEYAPLHGRSRGPCLMPWCVSHRMYCRERGRLHIGKRPGKEGTTVFSFSEVSEVQTLDAISKEANGNLFCFAVRQPPMSVVIRCRHGDDRKLWVDGLNQRIEHWKQRRREEGCGTPRMRMCVCAYAFYSCMLCHAVLAAAPCDMACDICIASQSRPGTRLQ